MIKNNIQLISLHIPKTAGTSFRNTLKMVYGEEHVSRLDIDLKQQILKVDQVIFSEKRLPRKTKVIHGHFSYPLLNSTLEIHPKIPMITWLRDPVERVISNYFYLEKRLKEELEEEKKGLNILSKMQKSLLEYAYSELNRNRICTFLAGMNLADLQFVGITEYYESELASLAQLLKWKAYSSFQHNITGQRPEVSEMEREVIRSWNQADIAIYEEALALRKKRLIAQR